MGSEGHRQLQHHLEWSHRPSLRCWGWCRWLFQFHLRGRRHRSRRISCHCHRSSRRCHYRRFRQPVRWECSCLHLEHSCQFGHRVLFRKPFQKSLPFRCNRYLSCRNLFRWLESLQAQHNWVLPNPLHRGTAEHHHCKPRAVFEQVAQPSHHRCSRCSCCHDRRKLRLRREIYLSGYRRSRCHR